MYGRGNPEMNLDGPESMCSRGSKPRHSTSSASQVLSFKFEQCCTVSQSTQALTTSSTRSTIPKSRQNLMGRSSSCSCRLDLAAFGQLRCCAGGSRSCGLCWYVVTICTSNLQPRFVNGHLYVAYVEETRKCPQDNGSDRYAASAGFEECHRIGREGG
jgi:hypothetical protein